MHDATIPGSVPIAYHDHGGDGPPVLLLHGLGGTVADWDRFAAALTGHRAVAVDLRGHGGSGDGPWTWDAVLDDLEAVVAHLGLSTPAVVGHSLGGWVAAMWGQRHPECPAVVNLDGTRSALTRPEHYVGMDPGRRDADLARLRELFLTPPEGGRPSWPMLQRVRAAMDDVDMFAEFARIRCPFLLIIGTELMPQAMAFEELIRAQHRGVAEAVDALLAVRPDLQVQRIAASHDMLTECPDDLAQRTLRMIGS